MSAVNWKLLCIKDSGGPGGAREGTEKGSWSQGDGAAAFPGEMGKAGTPHFGERAAEKGHDGGLPAHQGSGWGQRAVVHPSLNTISSIAPQDHRADVLLPRVLCPGTQQHRGRQADLPDKTMVVVRRKTCNRTTDMSIQASLWGFGMGCPSHRITNLETKWVPVVLTCTGVEECVNDTIRDLHTLSLVWTGQVKSHIHAHVPGLVHGFHAGYARAGLPNIRNAISWKGYNE